MRPGAERKSTGENETMMNEENGPYENSIVEESIDE